MNQSGKNVSRKRWGAEADSAFLHIWEEKAVDLRSSRKNSHIYAEMAQKMQSFGYSVRPMDMKFKINNFTMKYRKIKSNVTTGSSPPSWPLYERVQRIVGGSRFINCEEDVIDSIVNTSTAPSLSVAPVTSPSAPLPSPHIRSTPSTSIASTPLPPLIINATASPSISPEPSPSPSAATSESRSKKDKFADEILDTMKEAIAQQQLALDCYKQRDERLLQQNERLLVLNERMVEHTGKIAEALLKLCAQPNTK